MDKMNQEYLKKEVLKNIKICYEYEQQKLHELSLTAKTEGEIRKVAGDLIEKVLQNIFDTINNNIDNVKIISKKGIKDKLSKTILYKGKELHINNIQVDRHVFNNKQRICFIENKTYLDLCYYKRALFDFKEIAQALYQQKKDPSDYKYIIFAGQNAFSENSMLNYEADFWHDTLNLTENKNGLEIKTFFFLQGKRASNKALYKKKHELNEEEIKNFVDYLIDMLKK